MAAEARIADPVGTPGSVETLLARIRLHARRHALWMRSEWAALDLPAEGPAITHEEVDRLLDGPAEAAERRAAFYRNDPAARQLAPAIEEADAAFFRDPAWARIRGEFGLSPLETDLLALAAAAEIDPGLRRVYAYLHDDASAAYASPWLAAAVFGGKRAAPADPRSPLLHWRLARPAEGATSPWAAQAPWIADPYILSLVQGGAAPDPALEGAAHDLPAAASTDLCLYPELLQSVLHFCDAVNAPAVEIELVGEHGAGKRTLASQIAAALGLGLTVVDAGQLLPADLPAPAAADRILRAVRMARLTRRLLYWNGGERTGQRLWQATGGYAGLMLFGVVAASHPAVQSPAARRSFALPRLRRGARIELWTRFSEEPVPKVIEDTALQPAEIVQAAQVSSAGPEAVLALCNESGRAGPGDLFTTLPCPYDWSDIVLHHNVREHLRELEQQVRLRLAVYEEWGFDRLCPLGRGITALFAGPSGTGKTMAAQVIARSLELKLLRVDLAGVVNKYIGETEKRLKQVFDACERANVLLFFDEADALFGQRTQVKDAHDRFANIEIDYLLQRMEQFEGIAILATNRKGDLEKAFLRRIRFIVDFLPPGPSERLQLWQRALAPRPETGEEILGPIDWGFLAQKLNMTGAGITATALNAAFLARAGDGRITMDHVLHAARREMTKHGIVVRPGEWGG